MAGEALGFIKCDGCGEQASIKKQSNSKLLYLHCKGCGCDRRSGAQVQAKWQAAVNGEVPASNDEEWKPTPETHKPHAEIVPDTTQEPEPGNPGDDLETKPGMSKGKMLGIAATVAMIAGFIFKATRG